MSNNILVEDGSIFIAYCIKTGVTTTNPTQQNMYINTARSNRFQSVSFLMLFTFM